MRLRIKPVRTRDEDLVFGEYRRRRKSRGLDDSVLLVGDIGVSRGLKRDLHGSAHATPVERVLNEDLGNGRFSNFPWEWAGKIRKSDGALFMLVPSPALLLLGLGWAQLDIIMPSFLIDNFPFLKQDKITHTFSIYYEGIIVILISCVNHMMRLLSDLREKVIFLQPLLHK